MSALAGPDTAPDTVLDARCGVRTRFLLSRLEQRFAPASAQTPAPWLSEGFARVMVVASHADDEVIGCGGLVQQCVAAGSHVSVLFVTDSLAAGGAIDERRVAESRRARTVLGYDKAERLHFLEKSLAPRGPAFADLRRELATRILRAAPDLLLVPNPVDFHPDHAAVAQACLSVWDDLKALGPYRPPPATLIYEIWGPCLADVVLPLSAGRLDAKRNALACYASQLEQVDYQAVMAFVQEFRGRHVAGGDDGPAAAECYQWVG